MGNTTTQHRKHVSDFTDKDREIFEDLLEGLDIKNLRQDFHLVRKINISLDMYETRNILQQLKDEGMLINYASSYGERYHKKENRWVQRIAFVIPYDKYNIVPERINNKENKQHVTIVYDLTRNSVTTAYFSVNSLDENNKRDYHKMHNNMKDFEVRPYKKFGYFQNNNFLDRFDLNYNKKNKDTKINQNKIKRGKDNTSDLIEEQVNNIMDGGFKVFNYFKSSTRVIRETQSIIDYIRLKEKHKGREGSVGRYYILLSDDTSSNQELNIIYFGDKHGRQVNLKDKLIKKNGKNNLKLKNYGTVRVKLIEFGKTKHPTEYVKKGKPPSEEYLKNKTYNNLAITYDVEDDKVNVGIMHDDYKDELLRI